MTRAKFTADNLAAMAELYGDPSNHEGNTMTDLDKLRAAAAALRNDHDTMRANVADLLMHLRGRLETAQTALKGGDVDAAARIIAVEIEALQRSFLSRDAGRPQ